MKLSNGMIAITLFLLGLTAPAQPHLTVAVDKPGAAIDPLMYGIFFEDINFGADGGIYAELVINRSFEFDKPLRGWEKIRRDIAQGDALPLRDTTNPRNPRFLRVRLDQPGGVALVNTGFRGMGVKQGGQYRFSLDVRRVPAATATGAPAHGITSIKAELLSSYNKPLGETRVEGFTADWKSVESTLTASATDPAAKLRLTFEGTGEIDIDMVSLFPTDTWKGRRNGVRADIMQLLADMQPAFFRFPGGCIVEGFDLSQRYQWKNTIGPLNQRVNLINRWNYEFEHRPTPDYYQSYGFGYYEYFLLAEDIGAEPMPIVNCGMACQFNTGELVPMDELNPYVQDALDLIEFANGPATSEWGSIRAEMGHPEPFNMKMIGIGNEQWGPQYVERYKVFAKAIKEKYPDIALIAATGSDPAIFPNGHEEVEYLWEQWKNLKPEIVDEHFYRKADWFLENTDWYDKYERGDSKVFVGEWAAQSVGVASAENRNTWKCALYEAAFMTGLERNADLVAMSCYAPLFGHEEAWQWRPDMIWFDSLSAYGSANYHVQKLFSLNKGSHVAPATLDGVPGLGGNKQALNACASLDDASGEVIIKMVNASGEAQNVKVTLAGVSAIKGEAKVIEMRSDSLDAYNTIGQPNKLVPAESTTKIASPEFDYAFAPYSLTILRIPAN